MRACFCVRRSCLRRRQPARIPRRRQGVRIHEVFPNGGVEPKQYIIETTGSGVALIDYDNDGLLDLFVVSGEGGPSRLYHNEGDDKFRDVSDAMGLTRIGWGQGVCAGDYDNDGFTDLFVTYWGQNILYRNERRKALSRCY